MVIRRESKSNSLHAHSDSGGIDWGGGLQITSPIHESMDVSLILLYTDVKRVPSSEATALANSYLGLAMLLCYILAALAVLSCAISGFIVSRGITRASETKATDWYDTGIMPSFVLSSGECNASAKDCCLL